MGAIQETYDRIKYKKMVIGFHKQFVPKIKRGIKIHTIREDKHNRWKAGMTMHMATGVRTKKYKQFAKKKCISVQTIHIRHYDTISSQWSEVFIDSREISNAEVILLARRDGFANKSEFFKWFDKDFNGRILHWSDKKY